MRMKEQKILREEMTNNRDIVLTKEVNAISKYIGLSDKVDVSTAWKTAKELLMNQKNLAPTAIKEVGKNEVSEIVKNLQKLKTLLKS